MIKVIADSVESNALVDESTQWKQLHSSFSGERGQLEGGLIRWARASQRVR